MHLSKVALIALAGLTGCGAHVDQPSPNPTPGVPTTKAPADPPAAGNPGEPVTGNPATDPTAAGNWEPNAAVEAIDANLVRLRNLDVFEVGDLVFQMPAEAMNCYGPKPCAGSESAVAEARSAAAVRLAEFADAAEHAAASPYDSYACEANIDVNLASLRSLQIVGVGAFLQTQPANNPNCYNTPCPEDVNAAAAENHSRAAKLENIAINRPGT